MYMGWEINGMRNLFGERQKAKNLCRKHTVQKWGNNEGLYWLSFLVAFEMLSASVLKNNDD